MPRSCRIASQCFLVEILQLLRERGETQEVFKPASRSLRPEWKFRRLQGEQCFRHSFRLARWEQNSGTALIRYPTKRRYIREDRGNAAGHGFHYRKTRRLFYARLQKTVRTSIDQLHFRLCS